MSTSIHSYVTNLFYLLLCVWHCSDRRWHYSCFSQDHRRLSPSPCIHQKSKKRMGCNEFSQCHADSFEDCIFCLLLLENDHHKDELKHQSTLLNPGHSMQRYCIRATIARSRKSIQFRIFFFSSIGNHVNRISLQMRCEYMRPTTLRILWRVRVRVYVCV